MTLKKLLKLLAVLTLKTLTIMTTKFTHTFNAQSYIESVAYSRANKAFKRSGQQRADYVYKTYTKSGLKLWAYLIRRLPWYEAEKWFRLWYGKEEVFGTPKDASNEASKPCTKPGPECWAKYTIDEYKSILKKVDDSVNGNKSESKRETQLKTAVNNAKIFLSVKPDLYDKNRHGKWISESEFNSMLEKMKEIVARYAAVSTTLNAA